MGKAKPPQLPPDAPQDVKDFVDCKSDKVVLDPAKKGFLPEIPVIGAPNVTIEAVAGKPGTVKVTLKKTGVLDTSFTLTVTNGHLDVDTTNVTPQMVKDAIDRWVKRYNDWLDANGRKLAGLSVDRGKATVTKVPVAAGAGAPAPPTDGKGGGVKKAVGVGVGVLILGGGGYLGAQALGGDDEPSGGGGAGTSSTAGPTTATGGGGVSTTPLDLTFTCDAAARCGPTVDAVYLSAGVQITHGGSPAAADAPSDALVLGVTTWDDLIRISARCPFGTTIGQGMPGADGAFHVHLPLYAYGHCEITDVSFKLEDGTRFSDGLPVAPLDVVSFDVTEAVTDVPQAAVDGLIHDFALLADDYAVDSKVVSDLLTGTDLCFLTTPVVDSAGLTQFTGLCPAGQEAYGLQVDLARALTAGAGQVSGLDQATLEQLFGPDGAFPCGRGDVAVTICPEDPRDVVGDTGLVVQDVVPAGPAVFDLGAETVTVTPGEGGFQVETSGDAPPYVIIRNQTMTVLVPDYTAPTVTVDDGPGLTPWPVIPYGGAEPSTQVRRRDVQRFADALAGSLAAPRDKTFAIDHLDPAVLQVFPDGCDQHLSGIVDPTYAITVRRVGAPATYTYAPPSAGGAAVDVSGVIDVTARITREGRTQGATLHFGTTDQGGFTWFTDCGP